MLRYLWPNPASSPSRCAEKDTNVALVSTAPARLHCYLLEKAQFGLLKPVLTQGYQVFLSYCDVYLQLICQRHCQSAVTIKKNKNVEPLGVLREPWAPLAAVQSFSLPGSCRHSGKNAAHSTWITVCLMFQCVFIFLSATPVSSRQR